MLGFNVAVPPHVRAGLLSRNLNNDSVVAGLKKPMLITWTESDAVALPAMRDHLARLAPHAKVSTYPGAGHAPFWDAAERFNRELRAFREAALFEKAYLIHLYQEMLETGIQMAHADTAGHYMEVDTQEDFELARRFWS